MKPYNIFSETIRVAYGDLCYFRRNIIQVTISSLVGPLLYLLAFGYGMRSGSTGGADVSYIAYVIPGIIAITTLTAGFASSSQKILIQRLFYTSFDELILCPMHTPSIILGKSVIGMLKGLVGSFVMLVLGLVLTPDMYLTPALVSRHQGIGAHEAAQLCRRALRDEMTLVDDAHPVAEILGFRNVVRGEEDGGAIVVDGADHLMQEVA